jgi:hypothetical protein
MALTQTQLLAQRYALVLAMTSGTRSVTHNGNTVTYSDFASMQGALNLLNRMINPQASSTVMVAHDRGFPGPASWGDDGTFSGF